MRNKPAFDLLLTHKFAAFNLLASNRLSYWSAAKPNGEPPWVLGWQGFYGWVGNTVAPTVGPSASLV